VTLSDIWTGSDKVAKETGCSNLMILTCDFEGNETVKGKDIVFYQSGSACSLHLNQL